MGASNGPAYLIENHLYGSSRLGMVKQNLNLDSLKISPVYANLIGATYLTNFTRGNELFELTNHLGNVLVTVSDKKYGKDIDANGQYDFYTADSISSVDYTPFGMEMVNRYPSAGSFRYGFNGKEKDNEDYGEGNEYDYGFRIYNPRIGRFLSVDPLTNKYPELTPFQFASNSPIENSDLDGKESISEIEHALARKAEVQIKVVTEQQNLEKHKFDWLFKSSNPEPARPPYLSPPPNLTTLERGNAEALFKIDLRNQGYNVDGSKPPLTRLAENKTWNRFAENLVFPVIDLEGGGGLARRGGRLLFKNALEEAFSGGGTKLVSSEMLTKYSNSSTFGDPFGTFIAPSAEIDALLSRGLTRVEIAEKLGITNPAFLKGDLIRIDVAKETLNDLKLRPTTGNEAGANNMFTLGGKTSGDITEGVVNGIPKKAAGVLVRTITSN
jgi:RHS repeat-associated protein